MLLLKNKETFSLRVVSDGSTAKMVDMEDMWTIL